MWRGMGNSMKSPENLKQTHQASPQIEGKIDNKGAMEGDPSL
jgi:hypothetical protein